MELEHELSQMTEIRRIRKNVRTQFEEMNLKEVYLRLKYGK